MSADRAHATVWFLALERLLFALPPLVGLFYLYRRHERVGTPVARGFWWYLIALAAIGAVGTIPLALVALALDLPDAFVTVPATIGAIALSVFPLAVYKDAEYVRAESGRRWRPNPATYLALAFLSLAVTVLQPFVACYYLYRRHRTVGVP